MKNIIIKGARTHNLKNIDVTLPRDKLIVITGLSGSGKSSLAFDTIYAEGQRRYVESLSSYARQFLSMMEKPDIDHIEGLSPAISIEQKSTSHNPRSTVGTTTEIYDYLRLLYARVGVAHCPTHKISLEAQTVSQIVDHIFKMERETRYALLAPKIINRKGEYEKLFKEIMSMGFTRVYVDGDIYQIDEAVELKLAKNKKHNISIVIDRFKIKEDGDLKQRITESVEVALLEGDGICHIMELDDLKKDPVLFSSKFSCPHCDYSLPELEPRLFSFNAPDGACEICDGLGVTEFFSIGKMIVDENLSLSQGAIAKWGKTNTYNYAVLKALSLFYKFSLDTAYKKLPQKIKDIIWLGSHDVLTVRYPKFGTRKHAFEGIINSMSRRFESTDNDKVKDDLRQYILSQECPTCNGSRLNLSARNVFINNDNISDVCSLPIKESHEYFEKLNLEGWRGEVADKILKEIRERLGFLVNVGLDYLSLDRRADTLSGGENQRIRLASQIGAGLVGVMYVLDEPSIGLHQKDNDRLLSTLTRLRDLGNTVIVVEHDEDAIRSADYILDIGPRAGQHGGEIVAQGSINDILKEKSSLTGQYLSGKKKIDVPEKRGKVDKNNILSIKGASGNNLKNINVDIPIGLFTCVTGVSGSGKSTLINDTLYAHAAKYINKSPIHPAPCKEILGLEKFDKVVDINQSPIGRTPRSNPATYTGLFTLLREIFALLPESRARGYTPGRFSFNVKGGRCEACKGDGLIKVEMHFLPDVYVPCDVCDGKRYNRETLEIRFKGHNIHDVLEMTVEDARQVFSAIPKIDKKLQTLEEVGLSYIKLGQSSTTLSGGEAQRVKLSKELSKTSTGKTLYILDEPTTGLHFEDIKNLLSILHKLRDGGNTVVVIEHNLDVIKTADYIVDLGPEGGGGGGRVVAKGTPEDVAKNKKSITGTFLKKII